ncbi:MAG: hypothetical protein HY277_01115 [Ignavibacteriales bacterium]|nr:hypothetical protein [Ignavibacteriales bacterium]
MSKLMTVGMNDVSARPAANMDAFVVMEPYNDRSGSPLAAKGDAVSEELLNKLAEAGVGEIDIAPATPTEIACAQLCGLGHFRMRGYMTVQSPEEFKQWSDQQEAALLPQSTSTDSTVAAPTDSSAVK